MIEKFFNWLGYIPKQDFEFKIEFDQATWPFPTEAKNDRSVKKKPTVKKATTRPAKKPAVTAKTARTKKAK